MLWAGVMVASLLTAAPAAAGPGAHSAASPTECCFVLTVQASGRISADYGEDYATQAIVGSESYTWQWGTRELLEYSEFAGRPQLERPLNRQGQPTPTLRQDGTWEAESNVGFVSDHTKTPTRDPCMMSLRLISQLQDTRFLEVMQLQNTDPDVRTRFAGHSFVMRLGSDLGYPFTAPCLQTHSTVGRLEPPSLPNGDPDESQRVMGSRPYYLTLPPQSFLRQSGGAKQTVTNKYAQNISFTHGRPGMAKSPGDVHAVVEQTQVTATFHWFPRSRLAKNVQRLRDEASR